MVGRGCEEVTIVIVCFGVVGVRRGVGKDDISTLLQPFTHPHPFRFNQKTNTLLHQKPIIGGIISRERGGEQVQHAVSFFC